MSSSPFQAAQIRSRVPRIAEAAARRARLTVVPTARSRASRVPFATLVSMLLVGGVVGLLLFNISMQQAAFAASSLEREAGDLAARQQTLQMELEDLRNPQRIATQAQSMGMVIPTAPTFLTLDGSVAGVPTPATGEDRLRLDPPDPVKPRILSPPPTVVTVPAPAPTKAQKKAIREARRPTSQE